MLSGYLLSSQGDRMLMAHGVEGRFPFLDDQVTTLSCSMAPGHKLPGLNEKAVLKRFATGSSSSAILARPKQPYRAPDAVCFLGPDAPAWYRGCAVGERSPRTQPVLPDAVQHLVRKLSAAYGKNPARPGFSNTDNMALVGILSTQLLHRMFDRRVPEDRSAHVRSWHVAVDTVGSERSSDPNAIAPSGAYHDATRRSHAVLGFLRTNILFDESRVIPDDESFLTAGILDSTGILELIGFLEERFGVHFRDDELIADNFDSLSQVSRFVAAKLNSSPKP